MKPDAPAAPRESVSTTGSAQVSQAPTAGEPLAEPPKNLEFTEVPADVGQTTESTTKSNAQAPRVDAMPTDAQSAMPSGVTVTSATKPTTPKATNASGPKSPTGAITVAFFIFIILAALAYLAYSHS